MGTIFSVAPVVSLNRKRSQVQQMVHAHRFREQVAGVIDIDGRLKRHALHHRQPQRLNLSDLFRIVGQQADRARA